MKLSEVESPCVVIEADLLEKNLRAMQAVCDAHDVELWPHTKTHKLVPVLRRQLELGATGATCAKIGEAEALLASGIRRVFIAHSLADVAKAPRLKALQARLDQLLLAVTSDLQCDALEQVLSAAGISAQVLLAVDTGLGREGVRGPQQAAALAAKIRRSSRMELIGLYTHEGQAYGAASLQDAGAMASRIHQILIDARDAAGSGLPLWPGCSVTAALLAGREGVKVLRPGSYVFGDLALSESTGVMAFADAALTILATVVDRPQEGLALIDAGSKIFSSDKTSAGLHGRGQDFRNLVVNRVSEEHGFLIGEGVDDLPIGRRLRFQPAHVCPVVNLATKVHVLRGGEILETWPIDARGRSD